jgi:cell division protein FtsQ
MTGRTGRGEVDLDDAEAVEDDLDGPEALENEFDESWDADTAPPEDDEPGHTRWFRWGRDPRSGRRRGWEGWTARRILLWTVPAVAVVVVLAAVAWFTPLLSVRTVAIDGLDSVPEQQVREAVRIPAGLSILRVDTAAVAHRVAAIPKVRQVRVRRVFPSTVRVTVTERTAVLFFDSPQGPHLLDGDAVEFAIEPPLGLPKLTTGRPAGGDPVTRAAVAVLTAVPAALRPQVGEVVARSVSDIALHLRDGRTVLWGSPADSARKAAVVLPVLTRPGTVFDVSSPDLVTVR